MGEEGTGEISPFQALMTALSATIGNGNIAGVATAVFLGGPGALFWMWCTALVGMATKYCEAVCAVKYREVDEVGNHVGGPCPVAARIETDRISFGWCHHICHRDFLSSVCQPGGGAVSDAAPAPAQRVAFR